MGENDRTPHDPLADLQLNVDLGARPPPPSDVPEPVAPVATDEDLEVAQEPTGHFRTQQRLDAAPSDPGPFANLRAPEPARRRSPTPQPKRIAVPTPSLSQPSQHEEEYTAPSARLDLTRPNRRSGPRRSPWMMLGLMAVLLFGLGGVLAGGVAVAWSFFLQPAPLAAPDAPPAEPDLPRTTGSRGKVPVEHGLRKGDGGAAVESSRPDEPIPE